MFSIKDKTTAIGMYTPTYFIILAFYVALIVILLILSKNMEHKYVRLAILIACVFTCATEIIKMIFYGVTYGIDEVEFIPLYYCSMFMYASIMALFKNKTIKTTGLSFLSFGGVFGATCFFCYPSSVIPNYHALHFMSIRTMIYHSLMVYIGLLILITNYYKPTHKDFINYSIFFAIIFSLAYIKNSITGSNLMYISKPLNIDIVKKIYDAIPNLYPFLVGFINYLFPYAISYGIYLLIKKIKLTEKEKLYKIEMANRE